jgi:hypothetical protein
MLWLLPGRLSLEFIRLIPRQWDQRLYQYLFPVNEQGAREKVAVTSSLTSICNKEICRVPIFRLFGKPRQIWDLMLATVFAGDCF